MLSPNHWVRIATIIAVLLEPISAVCFPRFIDAHRAQHSRKMNISRTLIRTEGTSLDFDHVGALHLIEVELAHNKNMVKACNRAGSVGGFRAITDRRRTVLRDG